MKTLKIFCGILTVICVILLVMLLTNKSCDKDRHHRYDSASLIGQWNDPDPVNLKLNADSTFAISIAGSGQNFYGVWAIADTYVNTDTITFLILKNKKEQQYSNEEYFKYYFLEINSIEKNKLKMTDCSGKLRMNRQYNFKLDN